jgi:hypothetical protein
MSEFRRLSSDEVKSVKQTEGKMLSEGAEVDEEGRLFVTVDQKGRARGEMNNELMARDLARHFSSREVALLGDIVREAIQDESRRSRGTDQKGQLEGLFQKLDGALRWMEEIEKHQAVSGMAEE